MQRKVLTLTLLFWAFFGILHAQNSITCSNDVTTNDGTNSLRIQKCYQTSVNPVPTGVPFTYTLSFSVTGTVTDLLIEDNLPPELEYVSQLSPSWLNFTNSSGNLSWMAASPPSGAFSIDLSVRFKRGVTCDGTVAYNFVSISSKGIQKVSTGPEALAITASASDGWKVRKVARNNPVLTGSNVTYDIYPYNSLGVNGSHNLINPTFTDLFAAGALIVSNNCSETVLDVTAPNAGNSVITPYKCQITIQYPAGPFPAGSCPDNTIQIAGLNPCDREVLTEDTENICIVDSIPVVASGYIRKVAYMTNKVPGCPGKYYIDFQNNGNTTVTDFELSDFFPPEISVTNVNIQNFNSVSYTYSENGAPFSGPTSVTSQNLTSVSTSLVVRPASLAPGEKFRFIVDFTLNTSVTSGQMVTNTATMSSVANSINISDDATITVENLTPKLKVRKEICPTTNFVYRPGDVFTYRIRLQNFGSADYLGGVLTDVLDPRLEFVNTSTVKIYKTTAGQTASPPCAGSSPAPSGTTDILGSTPFNFNAGTNTFTVNLPTIPQNCTAYFYGQNGYNLLSFFETVIVEFQVRVKPGTAPGQVPNQATVDNGSQSFDSNIQYITINALFELTAEKFVSVDGGATFSQGPATAAPGATVRYRLVLTNSGNLDLTNIRLVDLLPAVGDVYLQTCSPRGSTTDVDLVGPATFSSNLQGFYSTVALPNTNPEFGINCTGSVAPGWNATSTGARALKFETVSGFNLTPLSAEVIEFDVLIPTTADTTDLMCNDYTLQGESLNGTPTQVFSSNSVCLNIEEEEKPCGAIVRDSLAFTCEEGLSFDYSFYLENHSGLPVTAALIRNVTPSGVSITPNYINLFSTPIADGDTHGPVNVTIDLSSPISDTTEICFEVIYLSNGDECCRFTHCVTLLPVDPCEYVSVRPIPLPSEVPGECCHELELVNDYCPDYFTSVITQVITPGVVFGNHSGGSIWNTNISGNQKSINWAPQGGGFIPTGTLPNMIFCLDSINNASEVPQEVVVQWMRGREIVCTDTLVFECNPCAYFDIGEIRCNRDGSVTVNYTITNTSGRTVTDFYLQAQTPNYEFDPAFVTTSIIDGGTYTGSFTVTTIDNSPLVPGTIVNFKATLFDDTDWCCHMGGLSFEIPDCRLIDISVQGEEEESQAELNLNPMGPNGIITEHNHLSFKVMPNPAQAVVRLDINLEGKYQIMIRDEYGRILHQQKREVYPGDFPRLDVSSYPSGLLLIQIQAEDGSMLSKRLLKL